VLAPITDGHGGVASWDFVEAFHLEYQQVLLVWSVGKSLSGPEFGVMVKLSSDHAREEMVNSGAFVGSIPYCFLPLHHDELREVEVNKQ